MAGNWVGRPGIDPEGAAGAVRDRLAQLLVPVKLVKVLGVGGNGVAGLFEVWPGGVDAPSKKVVIKSLLRQRGDMAAERYHNMVRDVNPAP